MRKLAAWAAKIRASLCLYARELPRALVKLFDPQATLVMDTRLDLSRVSAQSVLAITNGQSNYLLNFALAGVPPLVIPGAIENSMQARWLEVLGIGLSWNASDLTLFDETLNSLLNDRSYARSARRIAEKYAKRNSQSSTDALYDSLHSIG
ncbi:MAG: hypothetical protein ACU84Q_12365 [Gammaproteobacteria bacterium]